VDDVKLITVNELLQVTASNDPDHSGYFSRVNNISSGKLEIAWPTQRGIRLPVRRDQILEISFVRDNVPYMFIGSVAEIINEPLPQITVIPSSTIEPNQRRQNFRVKCFIPVNITGTVHTSDSNDAADKFVSVSTVTFDLSAGGMGVRCEKGIPEDTILEVKLSLPDEGPVMKIPGKVAYSENLPDNPLLYHWGIKYLAISEREQARIVRYLYRVQIESLQI
jgi:c-di-GMP-binding flagellar brake protein YcgR